MNLKRSFIMAVMALAIIAGTARAQNYGLNYFYFNIVDEIGEPIDDELTVTIYASGGAATTIYADAQKTAKSNPITVENGQTKFWAGDFYIDVGITDGTNTIKKLTLAQSNHLIMFPQREYTFTAAVVGTLTTSGDATFGSTGAGVDSKFWGTTAGDYVLFDTSEDEQYFVGYSAKFDDDSDILVGSDEDWKIECDTTKVLEFIPLAGDETYGINIGADAAGAFVKLFGATGGDYSQFNAATDAWQFEDIDIALGDGTLLLLGDTLGTGAFSISSTSNVLTFAQIASGTGTIIEGATDKGIDHTFWAETAAYKMFWDQDGATNIGALTFTNSAILFDQTNVDYTLKAASDLLTLTSNDHASGSFTIGQSGTNSIDVTLQSATAAQKVTWNGGTNAIAIVNGTVDYTIDHSTNSLAVTATDNAGAKITIGDAATTNSIDIDLISATASNTINYDGGTNALSVTNGTTTYSIDHSTNSLALTATDNAGSLLVLGAAGGTHGMDTTLQGTTAANQARFDAAANTFTLDNIGLVMDNGTSTFTVGPVASNALPINAGTANETIIVGGTAITDVILNGVTAAADAHWDGAVDTLGLLDNAYLGFGNTAAAPDIKIGFNSTALVMAGDDMSWNIGADGAGMDLYWHTEEASQNVYFDEDNVQVDFSHVDIHLDDNAQVEVGSGVDMTLKSDGTYVPISVSAAYMPTVTNSLGKKVITMRVALGNAATEMRIDSPGAAYLCTGLAGTEEAGTTEGKITCADDADVILFSVQLPPLFIDTGTQADLQIEFDIQEVDAGGTADVLVYEYGSTEAKLTDTITLTNGVARSWKTLTTNATGFGNDEDINAGDTLLISISPGDATSDFDIWGVRITYRVGIENTN